MGTDQETVEKVEEKTVETKSDSIRQEYAFAADVKLKECKYCRVMIPKKAKICPNCKMLLKRHTFLKIIAALLGIAVIGTGSYCLSAYWGLLPDSAMPAWIAQYKMETPVMSVTTVETPETAAGAMTVGAMEVAAATETAGETDTKEAESGTEGLNVQTYSVTESDRAKDEDAIKGENTASDEENAKDKVVTEDKSSVRDQSGLEAKALGDKADLAKSETVDDRSDSEDMVHLETESDREDKARLETESDREDKAHLEAEFDPEDKAHSEDEVDSEDINSTDNNDITEGEDAQDGDSAADSEDMDENEASFRADCVRRKYKALLRDKEYLGTAVLVMEAEVVCQVAGGLFDDNIYYLCREMENNIECYYIIRDDRDEDETLILEGDIITVYGRLFGTCKLPANLIETRPTVPAISMLTYDLLEE